MGAGASTKIGGDDIPESVNYDQAKKIAKDKLEYDLTKSKFDELSEGNALMRKDSVSKYLEQDADDESMDAELAEREKLEDVDSTGLKNAGTIGMAGKTKKHTALVFDCGTGETKTIKLTFTAGDENGGIGVVNVFEQAKAPPVLDFLECPKPIAISNTKPFDDLCKKAKKKGKEVPKPHWYFMKDRKECDVDQKIHADDFVSFAREQTEIGNADTSMIGSSAWHRAAHQDFNRGKEADQLVNKLQGAGLMCKKLDKQEEATFEAAAVAYACATLGVTGVEAVIGAGGGSVQFMHQMKTVIGLDCGYRIGQTAMLEEWEKSKDVEATIKVAHAYTEGETLTENVEGRVEFEIKQEVGRAEQVDKDVTKPISGTVICISACYYASLAAGISNEDHEVNALPCKEVIEKMQTKAKEIEEKMRSNPSVEVNKINCMTLVNLKLQCKLYKAFFTDETQMIFKRNWKLPGHESFRTTWSAGYYLYLLQSLGIKFPGSEQVFVPLDKRYDEARKLAGEAGAGEGKENVGMVLVTLKDVVKQIQNVAAKVGEKITPMLQKIAHDFGGEMKGLDFKIKGEGSLYRKLVAEVMDLMSKHEEEPSYTPSLEECVQGIKDSLRYTIIFPAEKYAMGVKEVEKIMLQEGDNGATANAIKFKNFWYQADNQTTYMGINSQVRINEIPDVELSYNYWYELQFHTAGSYFLKDEASHVFYEAFRDPKHDYGTIPPKHQTSSGQPDYSEADQSKVFEGDDFNARLYLEMLKLWNMNGKKDDDKVIETKDTTWKDVKNFKPTDLSICEYDGGPFKGASLKEGGSVWYHLPKASKRFHRILKEKKLL